MKSVIITSGAYGYKAENATHVKAVTRADGPIQLPDEEVERLIELGVAASVNSSDLADAVQSLAGAGSSQSDNTDKTNGGPVATGKEDKDDGEQEDNPPEGDEGTGGDGDAQEKPDYNVDMKAEELRDMMKVCDLAFKFGMSKADMVAALDAHFDGGVDDGEAPPNLAAEEPVT